MRVFNKASVGIALFIAVFFVFTHQASAAVLFADYNLSGSHALFNSSVTTNPVVLKSASNGVTVYFRVKYSVNGMDVNSNDSVSVHDNTHIGRVTIACNLAYTDCTSHGTNGGVDVTGVTGYVDYYVTPTGGADWDVGDQLQVQFTATGGTNYTIDGAPYFIFADDQVDLFQPNPTDFSTHFVTTIPASGSTVATTTLVQAALYANPSDFPNYGQVKVTMWQDSAFACMNSGAVYDAVVTCSGTNAPVGPITIVYNGIDERIITGNYFLSTTTTFTAGGKWNAKYEIQQVDEPWYFFGLYTSYNTIVSTTTQFVIGTTSPMDRVRAEVASSTQAKTAVIRAGIAQILASTTASLGSACTPLTSSFNAGDCLTLLIWPGEAAMGDNYLLLRQTPPWGYVFRFYDILTATSSTSTIPVIAWNAASTSPITATGLGGISLDLNQTLTQFGALTNQIKSDNDNPQTMWQVFSPLFNFLIYMTLLFMIVHDLTGIYKHNNERRPDK